MAGATGRVGGPAEQLGDAGGTPGDGSPPVILVDTIGELGAVWGLADVAFVGGSLKPGRGART